MQIDCIDRCEIIFDGVSKAGLVPPIVLKSLAACGVGDAHQMIIIFGRSECASWSEITFPAIAQPFINHGGVVHKVSVLGDQAGPLFLYFCHEQQLLLCQTCHMALCGILEPRCM